jgi:hypothetical protein
LALHRLTELLRKAGGKWGLSLFLVAAAAFAQGNEPAAVDPGSAGSAYGTAKLLLKHLAAGDIEAAARLSNAPRERYELLRDYRAKLGEEEFKRVFFEIEEGKFLIDDVPSEERSRLRQALDSYRKKQNR